MLKASHVNGGGTVMLGSIILTGGYASVFALFYGILSLFDDADHHKGTVTQSLGFRLPGATHRGYSHTMLFNLIVGYAIYSVFKHFYSNLGEMDLFVLMGISLSHIAYDFFTKKKVPLFGPSVFFTVPFLYYVWHKYSVLGGIDVADWNMADAYVVGGIAIFAFVMEKVILTGSRRSLSEFLNSDVGLPIFSTGTPMEKYFAFFNAFANLGLLGYVVWKYVVPGTLIVPEYDSKMILAAIGVNAFVCYLLFKDELRYFGKNVSDTFVDMFKSIAKILLNVALIAIALYVNAIFGVIDFNELATKMGIGIGGDIVMYGVCLLAMFPSVSRFFGTIENSGFKISAAVNVVLMLAVFGFYLEPFVREYANKIL